MTSDLVKRSFLEPTMDALALNAEQALLIANPHTADPDSLVELLDHLEAGSEREAKAIAWMRWVVGQLATSNGHEALFERRVAGAADSLTYDLHDHECNGRGAKALAARSVARALREPLRVLGSSPDGTAYFIAASQVRDVIASVPREQLLSETVAYQLGAGKFALLRALIEALQANGAEPLATAGSETKRDTPHGHTGS